MKENNSNYAIRKALRVELHAKRCLDHDQSPARYRKDAEWLNAKLAELGITDQKVATWGA